MFISPKCFGRHIHTFSVDMSLMQLVPALSKVYIELSLLDLLRKLSTKFSLHFPFLAGCEVNL